MIEQVMYINVMHQGILPSENSSQEKKKPPTKIQNAFCILSKHPTFSVMLESRMLYVKKIF